MKKARAQSRASGTPRPVEDPVVQEVRRARAELWREGGGTFRGAIDLVRRREQARTASKKSSPPRRKAG